MDHYDEWKAAKDKADETGGEVPEALEPPDILDGYGGWYEDFWRLSTERQIGMGIGPIPASFIDRHVQGWLLEDAEMFEYCIRQMDEAYLMTSNKTESEPAIAPGPPPRYADLAR